MSSGTAVISQPISPWFEIYDGYVDLQATAGLSVFATAVTASPPATQPRLVTLSLRYLRPCTVDDEAVIARGRVLHAGSKVITVETLIEDTLGRVVAHATGSVVLVPMDPSPPPLRSPLDQPVNEPVYGSPDPCGRPVPAGLDASVVPIWGSFLGVEVVEASATRAVVTLPTLDWFCNIRREVETGILAAFGSLAAGIITAHTFAPEDRAVTVETGWTFLSPVVPDGRSLVATATLHAQVDDLFVIDGGCTDADGRQIFTGRGTLLRRPRRPGQPGPPTSRVLLTVMFTDIVGSTEQAEALGDARWYELLEQHHAIVRRRIASHLGREVKTTGDGFLATFDSPSRAAECARAIRTQLSARSSDPNWDPHGRMRTGRRRRVRSRCSCRGEDPVPGRARRDPDVIHSA